MKRFLLVAIFALSLSIARPVSADAFTQIFGPFTEVAWRLAQLTWISTATAIHKANAEAEKEAALKAALKAGSEKVEPVVESLVVESSPVQVEPTPVAPVGGD